jgi:hypothetical protein
VGTRRQVFGPTGAGFGLVLLLTMAAVVATTVAQVSLGGYL